MSRKEEAPSGPVAAIWSALWRWTKKGKDRQVVVVLLGLGVLVTWQWDHIKQLPGVRQVVELASREPIPKSPPPPRKFRVAVANLDRDPTGELAHIIRQSLHEEPYLDVVVVDGLISMAGGELEKAVAAGHEKARKYLKQTHADVIIWGTVLGSDEAAVPQLYLTTAPEEGAEESGRPRRYPREASQQLPPLFWHDLTNVLRLAVFTQAAGEFSNQGHYLASKLPDFTHKVRQLLLHSASSDAKARASTQRVLADALGILGSQTGKEQPLLEAVSLYKEALGALTRQQAPAQWAATQNNLGNALAELGERESGTARLEEAVRAYRAALEESTREKVPLDWAQTQNNLGIALARLGERESGTARLEEAVRAYRAALEEFTREKVPLDWAQTQNNLGSALDTLGERESGTARLEEAVWAYRAALEERTREKVPLDWAQTQNNLGNALATLGERESGTARLEEAVRAYRAALEEYTREKVPLHWAGTQNNLGNALAELGERESGTARLEEAVRAFRAALEEYTREKVPLDWAMTQHNLGSALQSLGIRRRDAGLVCEALQRHAEAREVVSAANHAKEEDVYAGMWSARHALNALSPKAAEACHT